MQQLWQIRAATRATARKCHAKCFATSSCRVSVDVVASGCHCVNASGRIHHRQRGSHRRAQHCVTPRRLKARTRATGQIASILIFSCAVRKDVQTVCWPLSELVHSHCSECPGKPWNWFKFRTIEHHEWTIRHNNRLVARSCLNCVALSPVPCDFHTAPTPSRDGRVD
jgi:hypothetical protein